MHIHTFDSYIHRPSFVHRLDPRIKVILTLAFILNAVLLPDGAWLGFALCWVLLLFTVRAAQFDLRFLLLRSLVALPFALAAVSIVFTLPGEPLAALRIGSWTLTASDAGLLRFVSILLRSWLAVQAAVLLTAATEFPDLVHALRHLHVPAILTAILAFMYRYLFVLADESIRLLRAREARSARAASRKSGGPLLWRARVAGGMVGQLFLRSYERSDRVYNAMLARGYQGQLLTMNPHHVARPDWLPMLAGLFLLVAIQWLARI